MNYKMKLKQHYIAIRYLMGKDGNTLIGAIKEYRRLNKGK
jgi:hypothetical protein